MLRDITAWVIGFGSIVLWFTSFRLAGIRFGMGRLKALLGGMDAEAGDMFVVGTKNPGDISTL